MLQFNQLKLWTFIQNQLSEDINKKLLDQLYLYAKKSMVALLFLTFILTFFMIDLAPWFLLYPWFAITTAMILNRIYDSYFYLKHNCSSHKYRKWYLKFAYKAIFTATLWGSVPLLFLPYVDNDALYLFIAMLLLGLSGGAMNSLAADRRIATIYLIILLLPLGFYFLIQGSQIEIVLFVLILIYLATLFSVNKNASLGLVETYQKEEELIEAKNELFIKQDELNNLFQQTPIGVFYFDMEYRIVDCNTALVKMLHSTPEDIIGVNLSELPDKRFFSFFKKVIDEKTSETYSGPYRSIKGLELYVEAKCSPLINTEGTMIGGVVLLENKTVEKKAISELEYMVNHDKVSGLLNRRGFESAMIDLIEGKEHLKNYSILLYLDLNQFKGINDSLGHKVGDDVLSSVANRLRFTLEESVILSRFGGDEFVITIPYVSPSKIEVENKAQSYLAIIKSIFDNPFIIDDLYLHIQASIGVIIIEPNYSNIQEMIRHADITMYQAKETHQNISYYNEKLDKAQKELFVLQHDLAFAPENNELDIYFQPVVDMNNNRIISAEALVRWEHPQKGLLNPDEFIPLAIKAGLIHKITWWIVEYVCQKIKGWKDEGVWNIQYISININAQQFVEQNFANIFLDILDKYNINTEEIIIEITERSIIDNFDSTQNVINQLRDNGIRCAIDDFGIGYSSLSYLQKLSFHTLKIDREFIREIEHKPKELNLVRSILEIGRTFNYNIIIEGIESQKQKDILLSMDSNLYYQGYLFSKPIDAESFKEQFLIQP